MIDLGLAVNPVGCRRRFPAGRDLGRDVVAQVHRDILETLDLRPALVHGAPFACDQQFIADQRKLPGECFVTLVRFDNEIEQVYCAKPIAEVPSLELQPRNDTALHDAIGRTIAETGARFAAMVEDDRPSKVIVLIITDGKENASKVFDRDQIAGMIKHQREVYGWDVLYLGANQDAVAVGTSLGVDASSSVTYEASNTGARGMMMAMSASVTTARSGGGRTVISQADYARAEAEARASVRAPEPVRAVAKTNQPS